MTKGGAPIGLCSGLGLGKVHGISTYMYRWVHRESMSVLVTEYGFVHFWQPNLKMHSLWRRNIKIPTLQLQNTKTSALGQRNMYRVNKQTLDEEANVKPHRNNEHKKVRRTSKTIAFCDSWEAFRAHRIHPQGGYVYGAQEPLIPRHTRFCKIEAATTLNQLGIPQKAACR